MEPKDGTPVSNPYATKGRKRVKELKPLDNGSPKKPRNFSSGPSFTANIRLTAAGIELIWFERFQGQDAFSHQIYKDIYSDHCTWATEQGLIAAASWRTSKDDRAPVLNTRASAAGEVYPRRYYIRVLDQESTVESRRTILELCCDVRYVVKILI